ncbi:hypothetical protein AQUSIP_04040 [Aquicella siphonis]|uniref:Uncharacterized protein n=1 Tax=Aquicella siphonis TaxID=254247 RepID=A0A5E4PF57_9COXI|nr:hypothetical protein AQUSIP_04040 [Aquicella siphonis]
MEFLSNIDLMQNRLLPKRQAESSGSTSQSLTMN